MRDTLMVGVGRRESQHCLSRPRITIPCIAQLGLIIFYEQSCGEEA